MTKKGHETKSRIPEFQSREEEAEWFDTHDMADYQDEFKTVRARFAKNLSEGLNIRLDKETLETIRAKAHEQGIGPTTLVRMWILEHLRGQRKTA
ncbi:MAG: CopG family antitoxin [Dehalococcoidia bacterium]|nr:CopG family antitoxin [Dehalococcoidia bacterium]